VYDLGQCRLAGLAFLGPPSSRGRSGSIALPFAGATRPCVGRARASRRVLLARPRLARPSAEVVQACLAPRVWVWGVWFGFALRCVALLCVVFVRLHLALFPAGGPFLPSLYVNLYITCIPTADTIAMTCRWLD
jgi:hypothetical protein